MSNQENQSNNGENKEVTKSDTIIGCGCLLLIAVAFIFMLKGCVSIEPTSNEATKTQQEETKTPEQILKDKQEFKEYEPKIKAIINTCDVAYSQAKKQHTEKSYKEAEQICWDSALKVHDIPFNQEKNIQDEYNNSEEKTEAFAPLKYKIFYMLEAKSNAAKIASQRVTMSKDSLDKTEDIRLNKYNASKIVSIASYIVKLRKLAPA